MGGSSLPPSQTSPEPIQRPEPSSVQENKGPGVQPRQVPPPPPPAPVQPRAGKGPAPQQPGFGSLTPKLEGLQSPIERPKGFRPRGGFDNTPVAPPPPPPVQNNPSKGPNAGTIIDSRPIPFSPAPQVPNQVIPNQPQPMQQLSLDQTHQRFLQGQQLPAQQQLENYSTSMKSNMQQPYMT